MKVRHLLLSLSLLAIGSVVHASGVAQGFSITAFLTHPGSVLSLASSFADGMGLTI